MSTFDDHDQPATFYDVHVLEPDDEHHDEHAADDDVHAHYGVSPLTDAKPHLLDHFKLNYGVRGGRDDIGGWLAHRHRV